MHIVIDPRYSFPYLVRSWGERDSLTPNPNSRGHTTKHGSRVPNPNPRGHATKDCESRAFEAMLAASGSAEPPSCPWFSCVPRGFSNQFRIGHCNYWRSEDVTYDRSKEGPAIPERISQLYRWHKGNRPYSTPKPGGTRTALEMASQVQRWALFHSRPW